MTILDPVTAWVYFNGAEHLSARKVQGEYFVAHDYTAPDTEDYRSYLYKGLSTLGLNPFYADQVTETKHILRKICERILGTEFGIYDVSNPHKYNIFIELGVAIGLNRPFLLTANSKKTGGSLPEPLQGLDILFYDSYNELSSLIVDKARAYLDQLPEEDILTRLFMPHRLCPERPVERISKTYLLADSSKTSDVHSVVSKKFGSEKFKEVKLEQTSGLQMCALVNQVRHAILGLYHISTDTAPWVFFQLGLAIGLGRPWLMLVDEKNRVCLK